MIVLCASFGSSAPEARRDIEAVEAALRAAAPGCGFVRAYTSPTVRRILAGRGEAVPSLPEALSRLAGSAVAVQPTLLLRGREYDALRAQALARAGAFPRLLLGRPLLDAPEDVPALARAVAQAYPAQPGESLLLLGHGTDGPAAAVYPALQAAMRALSREDAFVATVAGGAAPEDLLPALRRAPAVRLAPLLLVAGEHARKDMAGDDPASWKSRLAAAGLSVRCTLQGLGSLPGVQALYAQRLRALLEADHGL